MQTCSQIKKVGLNHSLFIITKQHVVDTYIVLHVKCKRDSTVQIITVVCHHTDVSGTGQTKILWLFN